MSLFPAMITWLGTAEMFTVGGGTGEETLEISKLILKDEVMTYFELSQELKR